MFSGALEWKVYMLMFCGIVEYSVLGVVQFENVFGVLRFLKRCKE